MEKQAIYEEKDEGLARRRARKRLFWWWVAISLAIAAVVAIAAPIAGFTGEGRAWVALLSPLAMFLLLALGAGWFIVYRGRRGL